MFEEEDFPWDVPLGAFSVLSGAVLVVSTAVNNIPGVISGIIFLSCLTLQYFFYYRQKPSNNSAFEKHQTEVAKNMKRERADFIKFLDQEREAGDGAAFAKFMKSKE